MPRGEAKRIMGLKERTSRSVVSQLLGEDLLLSETSRTPLRLGFPSKVLAYYFPRLYPDNVLQLLYP